MDEKKSLDNQVKTETTDSDRLEKKILEAFLQKQTIIRVSYPLNTTSIVLPDIKGKRLKERRLTFEAIKEPDKALLYRMIVAAYNYSYTNQFAPMSAITQFEQIACRFVEWLNNDRIMARYSVLKEYEAYHFDLLGNHGGYSVLNGLKPLLYCAFEVEDFRNSLTTEEASYLRVLKGTRISPNLNKKQISLASYFGALDWLRRDDVGIGNQLYMTLASAKLTSNSLRCTASVIILELFKIKSTLRDFLAGSGFTVHDFKFPESQFLASDDKKIIIGQMIYQLLAEFHVSKKNSAYLKPSLEFILLSNVTNLKNFETVLTSLENEEKFHDVFHAKVRENVGQFSTSFADKHFRSVGNGCLLSIEVLAQLSDINRPLPITTLEKLMFSWLMASLTVQPSDIPKLSRNSFRLIKVGGRVTHIECEYFKGRANAIHNTRTLSVRKPEGRALQIYLEQQSNNDIPTFEADNPSVLIGLRSIFGSLVAVLNLSFVKSHLATIHQQSGQNPINLPVALNMLHAQSEISGHLKLFGLQAIKNSAVHAYSDPYTLEYLINHNSHNNKTEKLNYLTADNEEFINASGRITRNILLDLINNVFDIDFSEPSDNELEGKKKAAFNNEFGNIVDNIFYKSKEMLSRLKLVTEQSKGVINEVGVMLLSNQLKDPFQPIYVIDSKVTAFKMLNYLHEFKTHYKKVLCRNPDYLYQTVFPQVEWMEKVLTKLNKDSVREGEVLFEKMLKSGVTISVFHSI
jgi:hypothetical protein